MSSIRFTLPPLVFASLALASCVVDRAPVARTVSPTLLSTYDFVLTDIAINQTGDTARAGFNLDGAYSTASQATGCNVADYFSSVSDELHQHGCSPTSDPNCRGGVDNRLPELVQIFDHAASTSLRDDVRASRQSGHQIWLLRVTDVDDLTSDDFVRINLYRAFATSSSCATAFGGTGKFKVDNSCLSTSGDLDQPKWWLSGWIRSGMLYVARGHSMQTAASIPVSMHVALSASTSFTTYLYQPTLYFPADKVTYGTPFTANFGGWFNTDHLSYMLELANTDFSSQIYYFMPRLSDLPNPSTHACDTGTPLAVGGLSFGVTVMLQPAEITGTASSAGSGTCGTAW